MELRELPWLDAAFRRDLHSSTSCHVSCSLRNSLTKLLVVGWVDEVVFMVNTVIGFLCLIMSLVGYKIYGLGCETKTHVHV
jgi:hypothetical protein